MTMECLPPETPGSGYYASNLPENSRKNTLTGYNAGANDFRLFPRANNITHGINNK
ncbi:MAG: hypothetical protein ACLFUC_05120 [Bacteroidales bacterium]